MFGAPIMEHDTRYEYAAEWIEIMKLLWTREEEFDYEGKFLRVNKGFSMPKPIQKPFPPLMNAGASGKGQHFAAKYADMAFIHLDPSDLEKTKAHIDDLSPPRARGAWPRHPDLGRTPCGAARRRRKRPTIICSYYVVEIGDDPAVENILNIQGQQMQRLLPERARADQFTIKAGWGGYPLVGTAERIVAELAKLTAHRHRRRAAELGRLSRRARGAGSKDVMPRLEQAGLRRATG